ncbi:bifunctional diguanylate cyclase/phosphodiesterase [Undibacterium macrobrachii]|jgi:diguanylate cyclase (GGDEF)-like protein|uniref:Diguanylate cyclase n=1 Tax=Undibacterium macrobrachii TaxID=1119058 RepID=A0ABQ2XL56_9BURK|nr:EAL domain-containing protein [Undibacterium macrobrachii]GGX19909.1 diguanylate cyclase [Undibacterium macrobrachii]
MSEMHANDDALIFMDELSAEHLNDMNTPLPSWRVMIIDDDPDVHSATMFALGNLEIQNRSLSFLHAYSASEARQILAQESNIAVILLDVVMEKEDAGLNLVNYVRKTLGMHDVRIILRTGQPGYAPEIDAIRDYDINDYKTKSELTRTKLYTTVTSAIRSYEQICAITANQRGLELIVNASTELMSQKGLQNFASSVLQQLNILFGRKVEGLICSSDDSDAETGALDFTIIAGSHSFANGIEQKIGRIQQQELHQTLQESITNKKNIFGADATVLFFENVGQRNIAVYLQTPINDLEKRLLDVFCSNVTVGLNNVMLTSRLHKYAYFDPLTGLANRLKLLQTLTDTLTASNRDKSVLCLIDIDHFAETNDALGHQFGDMLLCAVAKRLLDHFGAACHLARVGGDTFALLGHENLVYPENISNVFQLPFNVDQQEVQLSSTIGLVRLGNYDGGSSDALKDTNIALKRAKSHQRSSFSYFTVDMGVEIRERVRMMHALRAAFENERLFVVYQPQIDMRTERAVGAEALLRWKTEDGQFVPPDQFIPIAEYSGLIVDIGEWVLRSACFELMELHKLGFTEFKMAVNVSQAQFSHPLFLDSLKRALADTKAPAHCVELEITESMAMTDPALLIQTLHQIKQLGAQVSIDDFGTGFSSLSHLQKLNVDKLKIDRAFVNEIGSKSGEGNIAKMIVQLSQSLNIKVIAEGVETEHQADTLMSFGCHLAQGYLYARPLTKEDLRNWLASK